MQKNDNFRKGATTETTNIQLGEFLHLDFEFYKVTSICGFT